MARASARGLEPAREENDRQRHEPDVAGERVVLERDAAQALRPREHADGNEEQQGGHVEAAGHLGQQDPYEEQPGADREHGGEVHGGAESTSGRYQMFGGSDKRRGRAASARRPVPRADHVGRVL